mmetsp:Transcript_28343/g.74778  ORF Transcript_28343/g.74778 Transcript_28343/m.74778 type:complete len:116 (-) Transcript_28343:27-374(-)
MFVREHASRRRRRTTAIQSQIEGDSVCELSTADHGSSQERLVGELSFSSSHTELAVQTRSRLWCRAGRVALLCFADYPGVLTGSVVAFPVFLLRRVGYMYRHFSGDPKLSESFVF